MTHESKGPGEGGAEQARSPEPTEAQGQAGAQIAPQPVAGEPATASAAAASTPSDTDRLKAEIADLKDRVLRAHAEMDNMRKRLEKEKSDASKYAITKFARDIVVVGDNFQRAIDTVPAAAVEQAPALKSFLEGVTLTERELINVLERHGIKRIDPKGQQFNPHHHQAVMEQPNPDVPSGTVTQVFQAGYMIEDRILRPAMVVVARGGFKPVKPPADAAAAPSPVPPSTPVANDDDPDGTGSSANGTSGQGGPAAS